MVTAARSFISLAFALVVASAAACFTAPAAAVQFSCDPASAPECPPDYACEADGCCHRVGSDIEANLGSCRLDGGVMTSGATMATTVSSATDTDLTATDTDLTGTDTDLTATDTDAPTTEGSDTDPSTSGSSSTATD